MMICIDWVTTPVCIFLVCYEGTYFAKLSTGLVLRKYVAEYNDGNAEPDSFRNVQHGGIHVDIRKVNASHHCWCLTTYIETFGEIVKCLLGSHNFLPFFCTLSGGSSPSKLLDDLRVSSERQMFYAMGVC